MGNPSKKVGSGRLRLKSTHAREEERVPQSRDTGLRGYRAMGAEELRAMVFERGTSSLNRVLLWEAMDSPEPSKDLQVRRRVHSLGFRAQDALQDG